MRSRGDSSSTESRRLGFAVGDARLAAAGVLAGSVLVALLAVLSASRRAARTAPTRALTEAAVETRLLGRGRMIGGLVAIAAAVPLFAVSAATTTPATAAATSELDAIFLVIAVGCLGPLVARIAASLLRPLFGAVSPVGGFLASANLAAESRRFSSASTPLVLTVAMSCTLLFSTTTLDHAITQQRHDGVSADLALSSSGPGLPPSTLSAVRSTPGVESAVALTPTTLGPSLGASGDIIPAAILAGGAGGGLDVGVTAGSLARLHGDAIALGRNRAHAAHADVGERVDVTLGDGTKTHATVVAIYTRTLGFGEALLAPGLVAGHQTSPLLDTILVRAHHAHVTAAALRSLRSRFPGLRVRTHASLTSADEADRETNRWLGPLFVAIIFAFTSIAVVNTLVMIALQSRPRARTSPPHRRHEPPGPLDGSLGSSAHRRHRARRRIGDRRDSAGAAQPFPHRRPAPLHPLPPAGGDPGRFDAPGSNRARRSHPPRAAEASDHGPRLCGVTHRDARECTTDEARAPHDRGSCF